MKLTRRDDIKVVIDNREFAPYSVDISTEIGHYSDVTCRCTLNPFDGVLRDKGITNVIFNRHATIVFWNDGTKTVVKSQGEAFDKEKGLAMAIAKKHFGNKGNYYNVFKKWIGD
jgi:hypothetical protein